MNQTWKYLKLGALLLVAVMMYGNLKNNMVYADACTGACANGCTLTICCGCNTSSTCGCKIEAGETGCGVCHNDKAEEN